MIPSLRGNNARNIKMGNANTVRVTGLTCAYHPPALDRAIRHCLIRRRPGQQQNWLGGMEWTGGV